jgi:polyisoprenoid-binding protein YceI
MMKPRQLLMMVILTGMFTLLVLFTGVARAQQNANTAATTDYAIDPDHTFTYFEIMHFGTSTIRARFDRKTGKLQFDRQARTGKIEMDIDTTSVSSGIPTFDKFLQSESLFDSATFPTARFVSDKFIFDGDKVTEVVGQFTMLGKTNPITLKATNFNCYNSPLTRREICGGDFAANLNRVDYGMNFGIIFGFSRNVRLLIQVEAIKQP